MGLMNDYICEAGNDETLQEDLDYILSCQPCINLAATLH